VAANYIVLGRHFICRRVQTHLLSVGRQQFEAKQWCPTLASFIASSNMGDNPLGARRHIKYYNGSISEEFADVNPSAAPIFNVFKLFPNP
jgi:hypothetical protein